MSLARSFIWLTFAEILFSLSGYVVHSGAGRLLSPDDYGRYALVITLSIMVITLIGNGIPISMSKYLSEHQNDQLMIKAIKRKGLMLQLISISLITLAFYILTPLLSLALKDLTLTPLFRISLFILPAYALDTYYFYYYTGIHQFNIQAALKIVRSIMRVVLIIGLIYIWKVEGSIIGYILVNVVGFGLAWLIDHFWLNKQFKLSEKSQLPKFDWRKLLNYAWPVTLFLIFYEIMISLDLYFIKGIMHNDYLTGIYNSSLTIARIPYFLFAALNVILLPSISKSLAAKEHEKARKLVSRSLRLLMLVLMPLVTLMAVYAGPTISFVFGAKYLTGVASLQILVFGIGFLTVFYVLSFAQNGAGLTKIPMWTAFWGMILNAVLNYALIQKFGINGSAIATSLSSLLVMAFSLILTTRSFGNIVEIKTFAKIFLATLVMFAASFALQTQNLLFIPYSIILTALYLLTLYLLKEISTEDLALVRSLLGKKPKATTETLPE